MNDRIGFGPRLGAYVLDLIIIWLIGWVVGMFAGGAIGALIMNSGSAESAEASQAAGALGGILGGMAAMVGTVMLASFVVFLIEGLTGVTPGKLILGLQVGSQDGKKAAIGSLFTRFLVKTSGTILTILAGVAGVAILGKLGAAASFLIFVGCFLVLGAKKQSIHDMVSKTAVYKKKSLA